MGFYPTNSWKVLWGQMSNLPGLGEICGNSKGQMVLPGLNL